MPSFLFWLAVVSLLFVAGVAVDFALGNRRLRRLGAAPPAASVDLPALSVVIAARNEARQLEPALCSVLALDYPRLEIVVVDDRSTDATGPILDRLAAAHPRLRVIHLTELPAGWLGKCHALHRGAATATGEWLLFTDADVVLRPDVLRRSIGLALDRQLDHLAVAPRLTMPGTWLTMFGGAFTLFFGMYARPWKAADPQSRRSVGIGAFNLVRAPVYHAVGDHEAIALRPDDDLKLGKLIKSHGYRQELALGDGLVTVEWYGSVGELIRGLEKNSFAGVEYNLGAVATASVGQFLLIVWPFLALLMTDGPTRWLNVLIVLMLALVYADNAPFHGLPRWHWVSIPLNALLFQYIVWRATLLTLWRGGIIWRGTFYSLAELRGNRV